MEKLYNITDEKFKEAKNLIRKNGGAIYTDDTFSIKGVEGKFEKQDNLLKIIITDKPFFAPWSMIEKKIDEFFKQ